MSKIAQKRNRYNSVAFFYIIYNENMIIYKFLFMIYLVEMPLKA